MRPQISYRVQDSCVNCKHCFVMQEYDSGDVYYCQWRASKRPRCGSHYMDEAFCSGRYDKKIFAELMNVWDEWSEGREVKAMAICDCWRKKC